MNKENTKWPIHFLRWFCPAELREEIEGDLIQKFNRDVNTVGAKRAKQRLLWNVIRFFRPEILLRNKIGNHLNVSIMLTSYLRTMSRSLAKQKLNTTITIAGLTIGISFSLIIGIFAWSELQVNRNIADVDRIYLLETKQKEGDGNQPSFFVPAMLGPTVVNQNTTLFESSYRFRDRNITVSKGNRHFRIQSMIGDSTFIRMFGFPVLFGSSKRALTDPNSIVITKKIALQFFGKPDVVGETLTLATEVKGLRDYIVTAVLEDLQEKNSVSDFMNMNAQIFLPQQNRDDFNLGFADDWGTNIITYIKLTPTASPEEAQKALNIAMKSNLPAADLANRTIELNPLDDYYLLTNQASVKKMIVALSVIALFILIIANVNFINITLAASLSRIKEIGVRKVIGGFKTQVILQFLMEAQFLTFTAGFVSLIVYQLFYPYIGELLQTALPSILDLPSSFWVVLILSLFLVGFSAGFYPAVWFSSAKAIYALKGKLQSMKGTLSISQGLMAIQFIIAAFVFTAALVVSIQVSHLTEVSLGYNSTGVLTVSSLPRMWNAEGLAKMETARTAFESLPQIESASLSWGAPNYNFDPYSAKINKAGEPLDVGILTTLSATDQKYADVYGLQLLSGKFFFDKEGVFIPNQLVINETLQNALSLEVGDKVRVQFSTNEFTVAGIMKDFHYESLHTKMKPVALTHTRDFGAYRFISFKLTNGNLNESVTSIEKVWHQVFPNDPFDYSFSNDRFSIVYKTEFQLKKVSLIGGIVILIIVLTGVLGLVSLQITKRTKELSIRKVLGAGTNDMLQLIAREYFVLLAMAIPISIPASYYFSRTWLNNFAYSIELTWWMFALPALILCVALVLLLSMQSIKSVKMNPIDSLRSE